MRTSAGGSASTRAADETAEVLGDRGADRARRQFFGGGVDRHDLAVVRLVGAQFAVRGDVDLRQQPGARDAAADEEPVAGGEAAEEMAAAEKLRGDRAGVVGEVDGDERKAAGAFFHVQHAADDDRFAFR